MTNNYHLTILSKRVTKFVTLTTSDAIYIGLYMYGEMGWPFSGRRPN